MAAPAGVSDEVRYRARMERRQLTLFLGGAGAATVDEIRRRVDPIQAGLIAAHVTLARDEEVADADPTRAAALPLVTLTLGPPVVVDGGAYLPVVDGLDLFVALRRAILPAPVRHLTPHVTLAHPRNRCSPAALAGLAAERFPTRFELGTVAAIAQAPGQPWRVTARYRLGQLPSSSSGAGADS